MAKNLGIKYVCSNCDALSLSWTGKCYSCGEWNTLQEQVESNSNSIAASGNKLKTQPITKAATTKSLRILSGIADADNILGGGIVAGSVNLLAGQPGIGKSTLLSQIAHNISHKNKKVLYVSAEESSQQVALRTKRLGVNSASFDIASSTSTNDIASTITGEKYTLVIVDSIQAVRLNEISSAAGSVTQITNSPQILSNAAKSTGTALVIVGHVTKEGSIAGPKVLEHIVDVILQIEGDRYGGFKVLRSTKNRYGSTSEAGILRNDRSRIVCSNKSFGCTPSRKTDKRWVYSTRYNRGQ